MAQDWTFYASIPIIHNITGITNPANYYDVPENWAIALTDVRNSTEAIKQGQYKAVNAVAAASIIALLNRLPNIDLPFVFGGDGATMLIPPEIIEAAGESLLATQKMAQQHFNLSLRIGIIPVRDVLADGYQIRVARLFVSENYQQALFSGGGVAYADRLLKDSARGDHYIVPDTGRYQADFTGFECRWNKIRSPHEETLSLMVTAVERDPAQHNSIYDEVLAKINAIYGDSATRHPITVNNLRLALNPALLRYEAAIRHDDRGWRRLLTQLRFNIFGILALRFNQKWKTYPDLLVAATDHEKFDDTLRMIISGSAQQRQALRAHLETMRQQKQIVYGIHVAQHALITCIVFDHFGRQVHFVDGADGGYALAAKEMKAQLVDLGQDA